MHLVHGLRGHAPARRALPELRRQPGAAADPRPAAKLEKFPASTERLHRPERCGGRSLRMRDPRHDRPPPHLLRLPFEDQIGYSRAVVIGDDIWVSGTTGYDYATMTIQPGVVAQCDQTFRNIEAALAQAGATLDDVVRVLFIVPDRADWEPCWPVVKRYLGRAKPASTLIRRRAADRRHEDRDRGHGAPHRPPA